MRSFLLALTMVLLAASPLRAADAVPVRAGLHADYGRIVFDWPREVGYQAHVEGDRLVVRFDEAASFDGPLLRNGLAGYAAAPEVSEDGRVLVLPLSGDYELNHFRIGAKVVLDLRTAAAAEQAASVEPAPASTLEPETAKVRVRGGRHENFSRLVFDWQQPVGEVLEQAPGRARIVFDRPADFDLSAVDTARLPQISGLTAARDGVAFDVPEGSRLRVDRSGTKVVLDVLGPGVKAAEEAMVEEKVAAKTPTAPPEAETGKPIEQAPEEKSVAKSDANAVSEPEMKPQTETPPAAAAVQTPDETPPVVPAAPAADAPTPLVPKAMGGAAEAPPEKPAPKVEATSAAAANPPPAVPAPQVKIADSARGTLAIHSEPLPDFLTSQAQGPKAASFVPVSMTFGWNQPAAAATFRRGENLWLVFDRPAPRDLLNRIAAAAPHLGDLRLMEDHGATILVIRAQPIVVPRLTRDGNLWTVDLRPRSPLPEHALAAPVVESEEGGRVRYPVVGAGRVLWVTDPDAGDRLVLLPVRGAGMGLTLPYSFPQFHSPATQQGIVLQPLTPDIEVAAVPSAVLVRDRNGLLVSSPEDRRSAPRVADPVLASPGLFDLETWRRGGIERFQKNRQALTRATTGVGGDRLGIARLDLARFFFAHGLESEALGVLQVIQADNERLAPDPEIVLMRAASELMMRDYNAAAASLAHAALAGEREALLWQAMLAAEAEDWKAAANGFAATLDLIEPYPRHVRQELGLAAAESFLRSGEIDSAAAALNRLFRDGLDERELAQLRVMQGKLALARGEAEEARSLWSEARDGPYRPSQARARLALIELGREEGTLSPAAAIEELERLRFAWRGDLFEFTLLRKLAELYVDENRHRDALYALRAAVINFPDGPVAQSAAQRMREIFAEIYQGPGDPGVPPLRALALYQEFMELTPAGPEGDRIIASLADRLVEVDLLDRAAELLEGQVQYRLEGEEKARIGARLALVHLLDREPAAGLKALDMSEVEDIPAPLAAQRRQLRARALTDLDRSDDALELLAGEESLEAERLRADIHWHNRQWPAAVDAFTKLVPLLPPRGGMPEEESQLVVNLAVALLLAEAPVELADLNRRYGAAMAKGPHAETFRLLVGEGERFTVTSIADELSKVAEAQDFMANYRARLRDGNLSEMN